jgi:hypothetical protein
VSFLAGVDVPALAASTALPPPGQSLAAFINALNGQVVDSCGGFPAGQCTALACAWCRNLGLGTPCSSCAAPNHCDGACWSGGSYPGWEWIPYSAGRVPTPGDLVCYHPCGAEKIGASGHVDVYVNGNASTFTGFDQNWNGAYCRLITHTYACVLGWQHPTIAIPPPPPPPSVVTVGNGLLVGALLLGGAALYVRRNHPELHARIAGPGAGYTRTRTFHEALSRRLADHAESEGNAGWILRDGRVYYLDDEFEHQDEAASIKGTIDDLLREGIVRFRLKDASWGREGYMAVQIARPMTSAQMLAVQHLATDGWYAVSVDVDERDAIYGSPRWSGESGPDRVAIARLLREANEAAIAQTAGVASAGD